MTDNERNRYHRNAMIILAFFMSLATIHADITGLPRVDVFVLFAATVAFMVAALRADTHVR